MLLLFKLVSFNHVSDGTFILLLAGLRQVFLHGPIFRSLITSSTTDNDVSYTLPLHTNIVVVVVYLYEIRSQRGL